MFVMPSAHMSSVPERQVEWTSTTPTLITTSTTAATATITTSALTSTTQDTTATPVTLGTTITFISTTPTTTTRAKTTITKSPTTETTITTATKNVSRLLKTSKSDNVLARHRKNSTDYRNRIVQQQTSLINNNSIYNYTTTPTTTTANNNRRDSTFSNNSTASTKLLSVGTGNFNSVLIKRKLYKNSTKTNFSSEPKHFFQSISTNSSVQVKVPARIIYNDLNNPVSGVAEVKNKKIVLTSKSPMIPKELSIETPDIKAMRYYRLWIYTCNVVLLMAVIIFCGVAGKVLIVDYRRLLVTDLNLNQPNFFYAYLAIIMQSGFLQIIGCLGALRLSEKLLNAYWLLLLLLLIGDVVIGIFWMFKFDRIMETLEPILRTRLSTEYGNSNEFSDLWDRLQNDSRCCGVIGPQDFTNRTYPSSCCASGDISEQISVSKRPLASAVVFKNDELSAAQQKSNLSDIADTTWSHVVSETREPKSMSTCKAVYPQGCKDSLALWLRSTADILFVLGYCVIAFLKLSFIGILRYEIREMIQKIKLLQNEMLAPILEQELDPQQLTQVTSPSINGEVLIEQKVQSRERERGSRMSSGESERESLLVHENTPQRYLKHQRHYGCADMGICGGGSGGGVGGGGGIGGGGGHSSGAHGIDTDAHSNCALLVDDSNAIAAAAAAKSLNGNNNFELTEFDTRAPTYRRKQLGASFPSSSRSLRNAPIVTKI